MAVGDRVEESGMLVREGGGFALRRDSGGLWQLDLPRVPVDLVGKRVSLVGILSRTDLVEVEGVRPDQGGSGDRARPD